MFYNINTKKLNHRLHWTKLPMPDDVIATIHSIANKEKQPEQLYFDMSHATEEDDDSISPPSDVDFIPDPIDPFDLILSNEVENEVISEDEIEALSPNILSVNMYDVNDSPYIQEGTTEDDAADN